MSSKGFRTILVLGCLALAALALPLSVRAASAPAAPAKMSAGDVLGDSQKLYDDAKFTDAIAKLRSALSTGQVTGSDAIAARALLGRCLVKTGDRVEARQTFKTVLRADGAFRLDPVQVPPDEMDVFKLALAEVTQEQIQAGQRVPASLGFFFGAGSGSNKNFAEIQKAGGGKDHLDSQAEFGGSVRFPIRPKLSLDLELARFRATGHDSAAAPNNTDFEATAIPLVASVYWTAVPRTSYRVNLFAGLGPMIASRGSMNINFFTIRLELADEKVGFYAHGGVEGEWLLTPKISLSGRVLGRYAKASGLFSGSQLKTYGTTPLSDREVNFSGFGAYVALRGYIGY